MLPFPSLKHVLCCYILSKLGQVRCNRVVFETQILGATETDDIVITIHKN